jgi:hypothetical protein
MGTRISKQDEQIKKILGNYFQVVKETFPGDWANRDRILSKTVGYQALMSQLRRFIPIGIDRGSLSMQFFRPYVEEARRRLGERPLTVTEFGSSSSAAEQLRQTMFGTE